REFRFVVGIWDLVSAGTIGILLIRSGSKSALIKTPFPARLLGLAILFPSAKVLKPGALGVSWSAVRCSLCLEFRRSKAGCSPRKTTVPAVECQVWSLAI